MTWRSMICNAFAAGTVCVHNCIGNSGPLKPGDLRRREDRRRGRLLGALRQPQFRGPRPSRDQDELPGLPSGGSPTRSPAAWTSTSPPSPWDRTRAGSPYISSDIWPSREGSRRRDRRRGRLRHVQEGLRQRVRRRCQLERDQDAGGEDLCLGRQVHLRQESALLRRHDHDPRGGWRDQGRTRPRGARRLGDHRPHLARRQHLQVQPRREVPAGAGRPGRGLQLLRRAPRQPRGHDARYVRQHPPAQPARPRHRGRRDRAHPERRAALDLRRLGQVQGVRHAVGHPRRQGVRHRLVARLGRQGHHAARGQGGYRRELRAHPSLEPDRKWASCRFSSRTARMRRAWS